MLGGRFRDQVRLYADTTEALNATEQGKKLKARMDQGFTYLKQDFGINLLKDIPGTLTKPLGMPFAGRETVMHPFTGIYLTDKGVAHLSDYVSAIREVIGPEVPLSSDHYGHIDVNSCIRLARAMEKHHLAWMEDMVPWQLGHLMKQIKDATDIPILTGEDIFLKEEFIKLIDMGAVDMIHPDLASSGGLLETKKIGDYAMEHGVAMAISNFISLEHHSVDVPWWEDMVIGDKPLFKKGFAVATDRPGLGIDVNLEVVKAHLKPGTHLFAPTPEWDNERSWDRLWS
jgi:L-alanine-DL-glutamate epimerase-like enolase superfamily enzyme